MASKRRPERIPKPAACRYEPDFVAEDDAFLDSISVMLRRLEVECRNALEWSEEAEEVALRAAEAFASIATVCEDAGMLAPEYVAELPTSTSSNKDADETLLSIELPSPCASYSSVRRGELLTPRSGTCIGIDHSHSRHDSTQQVQHEESPCLLPLQRDLSTSNDRPPFSASRCDFVQRVQLDELHATSEPSDLSQREEIIEIELTDLLTHTHEEIEHCKREFTLQVQEADKRQAESHRETQSEVKMLQNALVTSQDTVTKLQQELYDMRQSVEAFQVSVLESQKSMEAAMKKQSAHWKSMCSDLVIEKRNVAKKLAEERGKYMSLKEHLAMHASQIEVDADPSSQSNHDIRSGASPSVVARVDNTTSSFSSCSNGLSITAPIELALIPAFSSKNLASEAGENGSLKCSSEPRSSSVVSPASSQQSSTRELRTSDLSASHSSVSSSSVDPVKNDASAVPTATKPFTASFRRYYLSKSSSSSSRFFARSSTSSHNSSNSINDTPSS